MSTEQNEVPFRVYGSNKKSCKIITAKGKEAAFIGGRLYTKDQEVIAYLDEEVKFSGSMVFIPEEGSESTSNPHSLESIREQAGKDAVEKYKAELAAAEAALAGEVPKSEGTTPLTNTAAKLNPASTATAEKLASLSNSK